MKFTIKHEIPGRIRVSFDRKGFTCKEADELVICLGETPGIKQVKVYERTASASVCYEGDRSCAIEALRAFHFGETEIPEHMLANSGRELNRIYREKLTLKVIHRYAMKLLLLQPIRRVWIWIRALRYIKEGVKSLLKRKIEVAVLDATAIAVSVLRGDLKTAASVMFLLGIGETLEEWTHKKSVNDLARSMSLQIPKVWLRAGEQDVLVDSASIKEEDHIVVYMGNVIPFDGTVVSGDGMVNQSSLTGEPLPVHRKADEYVYAGSVLEEGELVVCVKKTSGSSRYERIVTMIEESEKLKSSVEGKAENLADRLVPVTLAGTGLVWLLTRNVTKTLAVLMVDFSCALKLAMPISVLSAIREAGNHGITVKGGKFLEAVAEADTIVFDKTGTLTKARPMVKEVVSFCDLGEDEILRIAACLEEHFPHSMAKAVVEAAAHKGLDHEEMHTKVEYIVAHGISTTINGKKTIIGSYHFVFDDENCKLQRGSKKKFDALPAEYSHLYLAIGGKLAGVICIEDPLRAEAYDVVKKLKDAGFSKVVMMTGDSERTAAAVAKAVGVDEYYSEVLPEDKAKFVTLEKEQGHKVIMIGDGVNDSPALSASDAGIAISDGAELAREIADITIAADDLYEIARLRKISQALMNRIHGNYRKIVGFNAGLIGLGVAGVIAPSLSATLHNISTVMIGVQSMTDLLPDVVSNLPG